MNNRIIEIIKSGNNLLEGTELACVNRALGDHQAWGGMYRIASVEGIGQMARYRLARFVRVRSGKMECQELGRVFSGDELSEFFELDGRWQRLHKAYMN